MIEIRKQEIPSGHEQKSRTVTRPKDLTDTGSFEWEGKTTTHQPGANYFGFGVEPASRLREEETGGAEGAFFWGGERPQTHIDSGPGTWLSGGHRLFEPPMLHFFL